MPIYEYICCECEHEFEMFSTSHERDLVKCPKCHSVKIKRLISKLGYLKHPDQSSSHKSTPTDKKP
jgi:putative FmdB family regulatory protein